MALFTGTYGLASLVGPLAGGVITEAVGWRGVFYLNLPIGVVALTLLFGAYRPEPSHAEPIVPLHLAASRSVGMPMLGMLFLSGRLFCENVVHTFVCPP